MRNITPDEAAEFVGGGNREFSEGEKTRAAERIAQATNDYARYAETRGLDERLATVPATVTSENGTQETTDVPRLPAEATSVPEGFGNTASDDPDSEDDDDDNA